MADLVAEIAVSEAKFRQQTRKVFDDTLRATTEFEREANARLSKIGSGFAKSEMTKAQERQYDRLKRQLDPLYAASKRYESQLEQLNKAQQIGAINSAQYQASLQKINASMAPAVTSTSALGAVLDKHGGKLQNFGFQAADFAVQLSSGTGAARALGQQLPQVLGGMGVLGALAGAAAAVMIPLGAAMFNAATESETLEDRMKGLEKSTDDMIAAAENASRPIYELRDAFGSLADEIARADQAQAFFARIRAENDLLGTSRSIGAQFGSLAPVEAPVQWDGQVNPDRARLAQNEQINAMRQLRKETGATVEQAEELRQALYRMETANSPEAVARDAANLQRVLAEIANTAGLSAGEIENLARMAAEAGAVRAQAERQVSAAMSEAQKIIDRYAGTTRELRELTDQRATAEEALATAQREGNDRLITDLQEVVANIDRQIEKTKELARETDKAFQAMSKSFRENLGDKLAQGFEWAFGSSPEQFGGDATAAAKGILELIKRVESGGSYNATLDNGAYTGGARDLVNMTINEVLQMQQEMLNHPANKKNSSAAGAYQIVRKTLLSLIDELGLSGDELYDPAMQDRLAMELLRRRRGQGTEGLRNEWEGLRGVNDAVIQEALGNKSIPRVDTEVQAERARQLKEETAERERQVKLVQDYGATLARNLVTAEQDAKLTRQRAEALQAIEASGLDGSAKAAAIAEVNGEYEKQRLIFALIEDAKRRQVSLDTLMADSTMTYLQAIEALGDATKAKVITDQQQAAALEDLTTKQEFYNSLQEQMEDGFINAIVAGESFADVLSNIAQQLAKAALQAALFGKGPFATEGSTGLLGSLFSSLFGGARAMGGPVSAGSAYLVGERGPEIVVPRSAGTVIPNHKLGGGSAEIIVRSEPGVIVEIARREAVTVTRAGIAQQDRAMPSRVSQINRDPLRRG